MSWKGLLAQKEEYTLPWTGGRAIHGRHRSWTIEGALPAEVGWHVFESGGSRKASWKSEGFADPGWVEGRETVRGYLVGDRIIPDHVAIHLDEQRLFEQTHQIWLVEAGLDRFARVHAARGPSGWIYVQQEFPLGPEHDVRIAYEDRADDVADIPGVPPALDLAFRWITWRRLLAEERRADALASEQRDRDRQRVVDFGTRAARALALSGSDLLDSRDGLNDNEKIVLFRFQNRRFECVIAADTLRVIDSGICLDGHDQVFTLESLPGVIGEAIHTSRLHVYRHVDGEQIW